MVDHLLVISLSVLLGVLYVGYLTAHPLRMSKYLAGAVFTFVLILVILAARFEGAQVFLALGLALAGFAGGYLGMARWVLSREDSRPVPALTRKPEDPGSGHTAVVYFTHGEPQTFDPIGWLNQFREFDEQKIPFVPLVARPFFIHALRKKYLAVGRSEHRTIHQRMIRSLEEAYRRAGDTSTRFYLSFLDDNPRPDAALIQALNEGASRLVVCEVFLTVSNHTAEGRSQIESVLAQFPNLPVQFTGPLHDSQTLQRMYVQRAISRNGLVDRSQVGVLLVGHGQPDEWDREWPTETGQEIDFRLAVLKQFEEAGFRKANMALAWMEFKEPKPAPKVEEFVRNGVQEILFFPAAISADSIHSQYDIPELVHQARIPPHIPLVNMNAWNDDPLAIQAIKEKVDRAMQAFSS
jgi:protoheme ferro-lyase